MCILKAFLDLCILLPLEVGAQESELFMPNSLPIMRDTSGWSWGLAGLMANSSRYQSAI